MFILKIKGVDSFRAGFLHHSSIVMDRALRHPHILEVILSEEGTGSGIWDAVEQVACRVQQIFPARRGCMDVSSHG